MHMDEDFFDKDLETLLKEAPRKPTIQGINSQESMFQSNSIKFNQKLFSFTICGCS